jgi:single-strand DNA-binding protein
MIKTSVIGNLGKDANVKEVNGKKVINFSVAHTEKFKNANGEDISKTTWVECAYWNDKTAVVPYLKQGTLVYVEGMPEADAYLKDGEAKATLRLRVGTVQLLGGSKSTSNTTSNGSSTSANNSESNSDIDDGLPF